MAQTPKKDILALKDFQYTVAMALSQEEKEANGGKRGRPSLIIPEVTAPEIRFDSVGHLPDFVDKQFNVLNAKYVCVFAKYVYKCI